MDKWIKMYTILQTDVEKLVNIGNFTIFVLLKKTRTKKNKRCQKNYFVFNKILFVLLIRTHDIVKIQA